MGGPGRSGQTQTGDVPVITTIPLNKLRLSQANVRKTGPRSLEQLAADIAARGVLQNLVVTPLKKPRGAYDVLAGGRRYQALMLLAETGRIEADFPVPVLEKTGSKAEQTETSLAENFQRMAMTPADECNAFKHFIAEGDDLDAVATRFGVTRRFVEGRLRLAELATPIFDALAAGELTLDKAKAYASTDNQEKQLRVFETYGNQSYYTADSIKRAIQHETMRATDPIALLVGEAAYVTAGGYVTRDLFETDGDRWTNPEIAERIASEMMTTEATRLGTETGLAWIRPIASTNSYSEASSLYRVRVPKRAMTADEEKAQASIEERFAAIETLMEDDGVSQEDCAEFRSEMEDLRVQYQAIDNRPGELDAELKGKIGTFLTLTAKGELVLDTTYYSEAPIRDENDIGDVTTVGGQVRSKPQVDPQIDPGVPGGKPLSAKLSDSLAVQRRDVLSAALLAQPALALDYALFVLVDTGQAKYGTTIAKRHPDDPVPAREIPASRAREYLAEVQAELDTSWTEHPYEVARFDAFRELDDDAKAAWLAMTVATSLEAKSGYSRGTIPLQGRLADLLEVDVAAWWRPTSENFFDRVSKATLLAILEDVGGPALSGRYAGSKKGEVSGSCQTLFAGLAVSEPETKGKALAWLPMAMQFRIAANDDELGDGYDDSDDLEDESSATDAEHANSVDHNADQHVDQNADEDADRDRDAVDETINA